MKPPFRNFLLALSTTLFGATSAHAQLYWDGNDGTAGFGTATGTWAAPTAGTTTSGWSTSGTGVTAIDGNSVTTLTTSPLNFGNGTTGLGAGTITVDGTVDSGSMTFASGSGAIVLSGGTINLAATTTITANNTTNTIASNITGAGTSLTKAGTGTLLLAGTRSGSGLTVITGGTLITRPGSLGTGGITFQTANTTLHFQTDSNLTSNNAIGADSAGANRTFVVDRITPGAAVDVSVTGSGTGSTVAFARNNLISFTKGTNITSGTPTFTFRNGIRNQDSTNTSLASSPNTLNPTDVNVVINGIASSGRTRGYIFQGNSVGNEVTGAIANGSGTEIRKAGTGTWTFSAANGYTGVTQVNLGTLRAGAAASGQAFGVNSAVTMANAAATLDLNGFSQTIGSLAGGGASGGDVTLGNNATLTTGGNNTTTSYAGIISGTGTSGLTKAGSGRLTLSGDNSYTGATNVNAGTLATSGTGDINQTSAINVAAGAGFIHNSSTALTVAPTLNGAGSGSRAVLSGDGTINATLTLNNVGDVLSPGNSPGTQTFTPAQTWASFSYDWEVNNFTGTTAGSDFDLLSLSSTLNLSGGSGSYILNVLGLTAGNVSGSVPNFSEINRNWTVLTSTGITGFDVNNWTINTTGFTDPDTGTWALGVIGNDLVLSYTIPEPSAALLGGIGMLCLLRRRR